MGTGPYIEKIISPFNIEFFMGMLAAVWIKNPLFLAHKTFLTLGILVFIGFGIAENMQFVDGYALSARIIYGFSAMFIVIGLAGLESQSKGHANLVLKNLGSGSYSIYLIHLLAIGILYKILSLTGLLLVLPVWLTYLLLCVVAIVAGTIISKFIEYPLMKLVKNFLSWRKS
jgi:peptidoglycan/LPS O-acetylase OafA/YrhL